MAWLAGSVKVRLPIHAQCPPSRRIKNTYAQSICATAAVSYEAVSMVLGCMIVTTFKHIKSSPEQMNTMSPNWRSGNVPSPSETVFVRRNVEQSKQSSALKMPVVPPVLVGDSGLCIKTHVTIQRQTSDN